MRKNKLLRIIVDTNLWISFLISNKLNQLDDLLYEDKVRLVFSHELLSEISATISKPKLKKYFSAGAMEEMLLRFAPFMEIVTVTSDVTTCRDAKDNFLLALATDSNADYLLTGDQDLLVLKKINRTFIVTIADFLKKVS